MNRLLKAIETIEARLDEPLGIDEAADAAGLSRYHLCRYFRAMTGESIMGYIRARRLSLAVSRLLTTDVPLIEIAFDAGFESQEAFTRAFKKRFGATPGAVRRRTAEVDIALLKFEVGALYLTAKLEPLTMEPTLETHPGFSVMGLKQHVTEMDTTSIPDLWIALNQRYQDIPDIQDEDAYGLSIVKADAPHGTFDYVAGFHVAPGTPAPEGMIRIDLEERLYAFFPLTLESPDMPLEFRRAYTFILEEWLPNSEYKLTDAPDFEYYGAKDFDPKTMSGTVTICMPVEPK